MKLLRFLLLLVPLASQAQNSALTVSLAQQSVPAVGGAYHFDKLVDARPDRSHIGGVHRGLDNQLVPAVFSRNLEAELGPLLRQGLPAGSATQPVVVRVHTLSVQESIGAMSETASAELVVDFLEPVGPDAYRLVLGVSEVAEGKGLDATGQHALNIRRALEQCLQRLGDAPAAASSVAGAALPAAPTLTWAQIQAGEEGVMPQYPVQTAALQRGVYRSFEEFRQNAPTGAKGPFEVLRKPRKGAQWAGHDNVEAWYLYQSHSQPRRQITEAWGLSDGQTAYIRYRGHYFPLQAAGNHFTFTGFQMPDLNSMVAGGLLGGAVGGAVAGAISTNHPQLYELRMASGRVVASLQPAAPEGFAEADTAAVYVYRRATAVPGGPLRVLVNGKEAGTLGPNQYLALTWRDRRRDMAICLQGDGAEACHSFVPLFGGVTYLACTAGTAPAAPLGLQPVPAKEGVFYLKHIKAREKKPAN